MCNETASSMNIFPLNSSSLQKVYKKMLDATNEGVVVTNRSGDIVMVNNSLCELFRYTHEELLGQKIEILIPNHLKSKHVKHRQSENVEQKKALRSFGSEEVLTGKKKNEQVFPVEISLSTFEEDGEKFVMALVADISERVFKSRELKRNENFLKEAEKLANICHYEIDIKNGNIRCSDQVGHILKIPLRIVANLNTRTAINYVHPDDKRMVIDTYFKCIREEAIINLRFRVISNDGTIKYVHNTGILNNKDEHQHSQTIFATLMDVSDQVKIENELRELNAELENRVDKRTRQLEQNQFLYKTVARNFPNGTISVFDKNLNYVFVEGKELYARGITGKMLIGTSFLDRVKEDVRDNIEAELKVVQSKGINNFELKTEDKTYMIHAAKLEADSSANDHILMVSQNITSLKDAEEKIQTSLEKEQYLNELKSRFVSMASHEFKTPLTSILNASSLLNKYIGTEGNEEKMTKHVNRILKATKHLNSVLNDFLSIDKIEEGKLELICTEIDIFSFTEDRILAMDGLLKNGQHINYSHKGEKCFQVDSGMLTIIYNNLLSNAIKYSTEHSDVLIETEGTDDFMQITVKDSGIGIPKNEQERLFGRFFRANNVANIEGSGLGLHLVSSYLNLVNGKITFKSKEGEGSEFIVRLPMNMKCSKKQIIEE